jgi:hypothetical protein
MVPRSTVPAAESSVFAVVVGNPVACFGGAGSLEQPYDAIMASRAAEKQRAIDLVTILVELRQMFAERRGKPRATRVS